MSRRDNIARSSGRRTVGALGFAPTQISNLGLWLRADLGVTTGATFTWADRSGNAANCSQSTASAQPTVNTGGANGQKYLAFASANSQWLQGAVLPVTPTNCTVFVVSQAADTANTYKTVVNFGGNSDGLGVFNGSGGANMARAVNANGVGTDFDGLNTTNWETWTVQSSTVPLQSLRVNGAAVSLAVSNRTLAAPSAVYQVGQNGPTGASFMNGNIAEIIAYTGILTAAQIAIVEQYLRTRYATW